jgi:hypothetical protein
MRERRPWKRRREEEEMKNHKELSPVDKETHHKSCAFVSLIHNS